MDFQSFVDTCATACAILSVEKNGDSYGEIRIVCANEPYKTIMGPKYYDNMIYHELVPKDLKFEDYCYRAALQGEIMHAYVETRALNCWTDQKLIPLKSDHDDMGYCQFLFEFTREAEPSRMASLSIEVGQAVIEAAITILGASDFKEGLRGVQRSILRISEGFSCRIMLVDDEKQKATVFCEEYAEDADISSLPEEAYIPYGLVRSWKETMGASNCIIVKNEHDMLDLESRNPDWVRSLRHYGVKSVVLIPLRREDAIVGWMYVVNYNIEKTVLVKELLEIMTHILGPEIASHLLVDRLEMISNVDALTGIQNRRAMIQRMEELDKMDKGEPFGVVFLDMNGLKSVNDHDGHDAGDQVLVEAAEILQQIFRNEDLFRTGGDEFIIISTGIPHASFERRVKRLRADMQDNARVSFAIGLCWREAPMSVQDAFQEADSAMYADKRAYYAKYPDARGR